MITMPVKAVIFDLDGTIAETIPLIIKAMQHALEPLLNHKISPFQITDTFGPSEVGTVQALAPQYLEEGFNRYLKYYSEFHDLCPAPFDGIPELLQQIKQKGLRIALVTGKSQESAAIDIAYFGLQHIFEVIETGVPEKPSKPACLERVIAHFKTIQKKDIIYVGDATTDIEVCREVGIISVAAAWAKTTNPMVLQKANPNHLFHTVASFRQWLTSDS